jgi:hypothetical protein
LHSYLTIKGTCFVFETYLDQQDRNNDWERTIENKGESLLQSDTRCDGKHSATPNDPDCGDPQSIPMDNYASSCPSKPWNQKTSRPQAFLLHNPSLRRKIAQQNCK